jgi:hypothetical protein
MERSNPLGRSLRDARETFADVAAFESPTVNWTGIEKPEVLRAGRVTASFFRVMGTPPLLGRYFSEAEDGPSAPAITVLSYPRWRSRMGADPNVVGKTMALNGGSFQIIGVMPQGFDYPAESQLWTPQRMDESRQRVRSPATPVQIVNIVARVRPGISEQQVNSAMERQTALISAEWSKGLEGAEGWLKGLRIQAMPLQRWCITALVPTMAIP